MKKKQVCSSKVWDLVAAFQVRKLFGNFEKRVPGSFAGLYRSHRAPKHPQLETEHIGWHTQNITGLLKYILIKHTKIMSDKVYLSNKKIKNDILLKMFTNIKAFDY